MPVIDGTHSEVEQKPIKSILDSILEASQITLELVKSVVSDPKELIEGECLVYQKALTMLKNTKRGLAVVSKNSESALRMNKRAQNLEDACPHLLTLTIEYAKNDPTLHLALVSFATKTSDAALLDRVKNSGHEVSSNLPKNGDENLLKWRASREKQSPPSVALNFNAFHSRHAAEWGRVEAEQSALKLDCLQRKIEAQKRDLARDQLFVQQAITILKRDSDNNQAVTAAATVR